MKLYDGVTESDEVALGEARTYWYIDDSLFRDLDLNLSIIGQTGKLPQLYAKFCGSQTKDVCRITSYSEPGVK